MQAGDYLEIRRRRRGAPTRARHGCGAVVFVLAADSQMPRARRRRWHRGRVPWSSDLGGDGSGEARRGEARRGEGRAGVGRREQRGETRVGHFHGKASLLPTRRPHNPVTRTRRVRRLSPRACLLCPASVHIPRLPMPLASAPPPPPSSTCKRLVSNGYAAHRRIRGSHTHDSSPQEPTRKALLR